MSKVKMAFDRNLPYGKTLPAIRGEYYYQFDNILSDFSLVIYE